MVIFGPGYQLNKCAGETDAAGDCISGKQIQRVIRTVDLLAPAPIDSSSHIEAYKGRLVEVFVTDLDDCIDLGFTIRASRFAGQLTAADVVVTLEDGTVDTGDMLFSARGKVTIVDDGDPTPGDMISGGTINQTNGSNGL
jgi:hypothetical protein